MCTNCTLDNSIGWNITEFYAFKSFEFETSYTSEILYHFPNYRLLSYCAGVAYLVGIFGLQRWMKNREAYELKIPLFLWNASFALFSMFGFSRIAPQLVFLLGLENGLFRSICAKEIMSHTCLFWGFLFGVSKIIELGDTVFIVLRKRPLVSLQWYHHLATVVTTAYVGLFMEAILPWVMSLNFGVHSIVYSYFAAKTLRIPVPIVVAKIITTCQFIQMLIVFGLNVVTICLKGVGYSCARENSSIAAFIFIGGSFLVIFGKLFFDSVIARKQHYKQL